MKLAALIIEGSNGPQYIRVVLYPQDWGGCVAEEKAKAIIEVVHANDCDQSWDECETALEAAGFTVPCWRTAEFFWDAI